MKTETKYKLEDVISDKSIVTPIEIIKKLDDFLSNIKNANVMCCGLKVYTYTQMSSNYKFEKNDADSLEFPIFFGKWVNKEQTISLYLSPNKCKEDEFIIE